MRESQENDGRQGYIVSRGGFFLTSHEDVTFGRLHLSNSCLETWKDTSEAKRKRLTP